MVLETNDILNILKNNPNKDLINRAKEYTNTLLLHTQGIGLKEALKRKDYFENGIIHKSRQNESISNKDLFARVLQKEELVFTAKGGTSFYNGLAAGSKEEEELNAIVDNIRFGQSLKQWVKNFALEAFRSDPMGVVHIEIDDMGKAYPTYKTIGIIYDYMPNGRYLEYLCYQLMACDAIHYGVKDTKLVNLKPTQKTNYYRIIDDKKDYIFKYESNVLTEQIELTKDNVFKKCPAFIVSDKISFLDNKFFLSPLDKTIELATSFLNDRSVRDQTKNFCAFPKSIEPLLKCPVCDGTGLVSAHPCPACTLEGKDRGTGYNMHTKVSDTARFPLDALREGFDYNKIFGYVSPDVAILNKQDTSLCDLENLISDVYWGTDNRQQTTGADITKSSIEETATKTVANLQPIYARLNNTADWSERTTNEIVNFIGKLLFPDKFKSSNITYGRYYILETPFELMEEYLDMKTKGAPQFALTDSLKRYYHSFYQTNSRQLAIKTKLICVEPFVHNTVQEVQLMNLPQRDFYAKIYFNEWLTLQQDSYLMATSCEQMIIDLYKYSDSKIQIDDTTPNAN